jgi:tetratricopeptide (TPR) repeat protein
MSVPAAFEARAWQAFYDSEWQPALKAVKRWLRDQPFAASPAIHGSYIAAIPLQDHEQALRIVEQGLLANPNHPSLLNNKAYSLAQLGRIREAEDALRRAHSKTEDGPTSIILRATQGLLAYRSGNPQQGNHLYRSAIETAQKAGQQSLARKAALFFALEELRIAAQDAGKLAEHALNDSAEDATSDVRLLRRRIELAIINRR